MWKIKHAPCRKTCRGIAADDLDLQHLIERRAKAGTEMPNRIAGLRSGGFAKVTSDYAPKLVSGVNHAFASPYKGLVEDGVVSTHAHVLSFRIIIVEPSGKKVVELVAAEGYRERRQRSDLSIS